MQPPLRDGRKAYLNELMRGRFSSSLNRSPSLVALFIVRFCTSRTILCDRTPASNPLALWRRPFFAAPAYPRCPFFPIRSLPRWLRLPVPFPFFLRRIALSGSSFYVEGPSEDSVFAGIPFFFSNFPTSVPPSKDWGFLPFFFFSPPQPQLTQFYLSSLLHPLIKGNRTSS